MPEDYKIGDYVRYIGDTDTNGPLLYKYSIGIVDKTFERDHILVDFKGITKLIHGDLLEKTFSPCEQLIKLLKKRFTPSEAFEWLTISAMSQPAPLQMIMDGKIHEAMIQLDPTGQLLA